MLECEYANIVKVNDSARDVAETIRQSEYSSILFAMYRGKPYDKLIWRLLWEAGKVGNHNIFLLLYYYYY